MKKKHVLIMASLAFLSLVSCQKEENDTIDNTSSSTVADNSELSVAAANKLQQLGFDIESLERKELKTRGGEVKEGWLGDDIVITDEELEAIKIEASEGEGNEKAFIRNGIINTNQGSSFGGVRFVSVGFVPSFQDVGQVVPIPQAQRRALSRAVNAINNIGLRVFFVIQPDGTGNEINFQGGFASSGSIEGFAPIPVNGNFGSGFADATAPNEQVLGAVYIHELMHSLGYRHSDFRTRASCSFVNRPEMVFDENSIAPIDENFVQGTTFSGNFFDSVLTSCYIGNFNLTIEDVNALRSIYGR